MTTARVSSPQVLCVGELLWDCLADQAGLPIEAIEAWTLYPGGAPANVACALSRLGVPAGFIGSVGTDSTGRELLDCLQQAGVNCEGVQHHPTAPTRQVCVLRDNRGDRQFAAFRSVGRITSDPRNFADTHLQASLLHPQQFTQADYLVLGTLALAYPDSSAAIRQALDLADDNYLKIVLDLNWRPVFWPDPSIARGTIAPLLDRVDFLKLASEEAEWLFGTAEPATIADKLDHLEAVIVTDGDRGCDYIIGDRTGFVPAFSVPTVDTTGAGDAFVAAFVAQLCERGLSSFGNPLVARYAVAFASAAGALTTTQPGAIDALPDRAAIELLLAQEGWSSPL